MRQPFWHPHILSIDTKCFSVLFASKIIEGKRWKQFYSKSSCMFFIDFHQYPPQATLPVCLCHMTGAGLCAGLWLPNIPRWWTGLWSWTSHQCLCGIKALHQSANLCSFCVPGNIVFPNHYLNYLITLMKKLEGKTHERMSFCFHFHVCLYVCLYAGYRAHF